MIFPRHDELVKRNFKVIQSGHPFPEYFGLEEKRIWILAKYLIDDEYEIHAAKSSRGIGYGSVELNCSGRFDKIESLEQFINFLESPNQLENLPYIETS